jgi:ubiquinol-cytochrome c reductase cytochrome b subunit
MSDFTSGTLRDSVTNEGKGLSRWLSTTSGIVLMLLFVQFASGLLLSFYYVPSVDHAYTTVVFIEKAASSGSWLRSLHYYGSQWLPFFVFLHLLRLLSCEAYKYWKPHWMVAVILLGLVMAAGATGYSLPWDARAFFSTRVAEGLLGGLPFLGRNARLWLLGGDEISTLTLSRFFALHVVVTPFLILLIVGFRLAKQGPRHVCLATINRNAIAAGVVFVGLALWTLKFRAPLGPSVSDAAAEYLPRPGGQFLWLYQSLKYVPGSLGSIIGIVIPGLALLILFALPWLDVATLRRISTSPQRLIATLILGVAVVWIVGMTTTSYLGDRRDPRIRQHLAKQAADEDAFRRTPFRPVALKTSDETSRNPPPRAYTTSCAICHGGRGEGATQGNLKFPPLIGVASKPRRTRDDIIGLLNDPAAYGLQPPMRSFATKLTEEEKREISDWVVTLK